MHAISHREFIVQGRRFLGRPVLFHCTECERVKFASGTAPSQERWEKESDALGRMDLDSDQVWYFHTCCERCHMDGDQSASL